jgi:LysM repeat protein
MNRKPSSPQRVIDNYQRRQRRSPVVIYVLAGILVIIGIVLLVLQLTPLGANLFAGSSPTPTATQTFTPSPSPTNTVEPTSAVTETPAGTATISGPFGYIVQSGDTCYDIARRYNVDLLTLIAINNLPANCPLVDGQQIIVPAPGQSLPTATPVPPTVPKGTVVQYTVQYGDSLQSIASKFNSTIDDIRQTNKLAADATLTPGQVLNVRVNLVTPTPTFAPTSTLSISGTPILTIIAPPTRTPTLAPATQTPAATATP